ncbi:putative bifunctional diguanylate cyclase/phosphodiesterase [Caldimonas tepidiphila]|uniref:putative bifunctional diguanylate cyclase/phosphodiesterase n=1 Tax=Caldimonas tepidiphila TaxID=2315841 RepID=UPI0014766223|nr:EAL domain-containing protein [Caldimonas tepidiphila]
MLSWAGVMAALQYLSLAQRFSAELATQARIVGQGATAALVFEDAREAAQLLAVLAAAPQVHSARLLHDDGRLVAQYEREDRKDWVSALAGLETVAQPVRIDQRQVGWLVLEGSRDAVLRDVAKFSAGGLGIMAAAMVLLRFASRGLRASVRAAEEHTRHMALHDALTGLPNRAAFHHALEQAVAPGARAHALLFIDLDNFKQINDTHGHPGGDRVLRVVAQRLRERVAPGGIVARLGGDEFALLLDAGDQPLDAAGRIAEDLVRRIPEPIDFEGRRLRVSVSVGVALLPHDAATADDAMQCADAAMYLAKREGKDAWRLYSPALGDEIRARLSLEADLRAAIEARQLHLHYQRIFDAGGRVVSMEALLRWQHPVRGTVMPSRFIELAESSGLIAELGLAALHCVRRDLDAARRAGVPLPRIALNLSSHQFRRTAHRQRFLAALDELALTPAQLEFELTETAVFEDISQPGSILRALRERGYALAIDDFGTGYSSLSYLRRLQCSKLKIDQSFIRDLGSSEEAVAMVQSMIDVAHALHMQVVAEGVETEAMRARLVQMGCELMQGFLLSRPQPVEALLEPCLRDAPPLPPAPAGVPRDAALPAS